MCSAVYIVIKGMNTVSENGGNAASISTHIARFFSSSKDSSVVYPAQSQKCTSKGPVLLAGVLGDEITKRTSTELCRQSDRSSLSQKKQSGKLDVNRKEYDSSEGRVVDKIRGKFVQRVYKTTLMNKDRAFPSALYRPPPHPLSTNSNKKDNGGWRVVL